MKLNKQAMDDLSMGAFGEIEGFLGAFSNLEEMINQTDSENGEAVLSWAKEEKGLIPEVVSLLSRTII